MRNWVHCVVVLTVIHFAGWGFWQKIAMGASFVTKAPKIHSSARLIDCCGIIMAVDPTQGVIIVNEKRVVVGKFSINDKVIGTRMLNTEGKTIDIAGFSHGQWVTIRGYVVAQSKLFAVSVQADTGYLRKNTNEIRKLQVPPF